MRLSSAVFQFHLFYSDPGQISRATSPPGSLPWLVVIHWHCTSPASVYAGEMVSRLLPMATERSPSLLSQQAFRYLYLLSKVRGAKVILRWFSHEVSDLEPVLSLLESEDVSQPQVETTHLCNSPK